MQILKQIYRSSYSGEEVVTKLTYQDGEWNPETEIIPNQVFNTHTTTQAVVFGNGATRKEFDLAHIERHKGGLFGTNRLQSYGCNHLYKEFTPDFLVIVGKENADEIARTTYPNNNIVYAHGEHLINHPNKFYLIPQNISYDAGAIAAYMAAFDGHKKVFLMGFDSYTVDPVHQTQAFFIKTLLSVINTYNDVEFVRVTPTEDYSCSEELLSQPNFRQIDFRKFVIEADIG